MILPGGLKVTLVAIDRSEAMLPTDEPEALALLARVKAACRYARANVVNTTKSMEMPAPPDECIVTAGSVRCTFLHVRSPDGAISRQLTIAMSGARELTDLPHPVACAVIAKTFGFEGEMFEGYQAEAIGCGCGLQGCASVAIICYQPIAAEN